MVNRWNAVYSWFFNELVGLAQSQPKIHFFKISVHLKLMFYSLFKNMLFIVFWLILISVSRKAVEPFFLTPNHHRIGMCKPSPLRGANISSFSSLNNCCILKVFLLFSKHICAHHETISFFEFSSSLILPNKSQKKNYHLKDIIKE